MKILAKCSLLILPSMLLLGGCGSTGEVEEDPSAVAGGGAAVAPEPTPTPVAQPEPKATPMPEPEPEPQRNPLEMGMLAQRVVYFDFDSSVVKDEAMPMLRAHAEFLSSNPQPITLEGHCDERGTREYNIALGERRADAVRRVLMANGVNGGQINIVSYGEERPAALGHNESAWSQNRRTELVYQR